MNGIVETTAAGLSYRRAGGGADTPLVLLHGIGSNGGSFAALMAALGGERTAVAWDAPGYGRSEPLAKDWPDAGDYADALARLLDAIGIARCILAGHSLGTLIAARFARRWPERVAALALISPTLGYGGTPGAPLPAKVGARIEALDRLGPAAFAAERAPGLVGDPAARPDVVAAVERAMAAIRRPGYDQATRMLGSARLLADAAALGVPTAVVVGTLDRITPPPIAREVVAALPAAAAPRLVEIPGAGHAVCQEMPDAVATVLGELAGQSPAHAAEA
ncbi:MAG TPA: alpha/beta fold hydrolase [Hyphomicrobiales bacterium]|nr:alpha/beta fold hydrolase [Hyphomicrobiales bacterium]